MDKLSVFEDDDLLGTISVRVPTVEYNDLILMCKNREVFDIGNEQVLNKALLPGLMMSIPYKSTFLLWMEKRYSEKSNTFARQLRSYVYGQGNRSKINIGTRALGLSDCYWLKDRKEEVTFEEVSPYYTDFWSGAGLYEGQAIPTLYVNGYLPKYWADRNTLIKKSTDTVQANREIYCSILAEALGLPVAKAAPSPEGVAVTNFTNPALMFESADASGKIHGEEFTTEDVLSAFGSFGFDMLFFDALVANGDRHAGNFGFLRDPDTGAYLSAAPLFDFDHAFESRVPDDVLTREVRSVKSGFRARFEQLDEGVRNMDVSDYVIERLDFMGQ
ncbi:hypothetical protein [Paenibacillus koleovorans]|uniref:hypothetical protein n=1 Tax=Paenibacillus koleovorans TaxID=121608 RepID=UPI000FDAFFA8|nr:hypothetical protein [Paenibacillus koleovorans]